MQNKKASTPLAIALFTLAVIVMLTLVWYKFHTARTEAVSVLTISPDTMENFMTKESKIDFYIQQMLQNSAKSGSKQEFINNMRQELQFYQYDNYYIIPELQQVEQQLLEENIVFNEKNISLSVTLEIHEYAKKEDYTMLDVSRSVKKTYTAQRRLN